MSRPKFDTLFTGDWPYDKEDGVGLLLEGVPTDRDAFIAYLTEYSCHPSAGARIYSRLVCDGYDKLTVMARLDFDQIALHLLEQGVRTSIIPPLLSWERRYDDGPWPRG